MKERPIIFTTESVRAILEGRKSQTRRVIKPQPASHWDNAKPILNDQQSVISWCFYNTQDPDFHGYKKCPYGQVGDRLWVRETWWTPPHNKIDKNPNIVSYKEIIYSASGQESASKHTWYPSIFMPRWASRITLEITEVRVERIQDISADDVKAEGSGWDFYLLWDSLNAKRGYGWEVNPWVWVISFAMGVRLK